MDIESGHEEVYKPLTTKKHAPPAASRRSALFLTATKVLCLLMVLSLLGYYVYVTVTMDDATAQLVRDVSKLKQHNHQHRNSSNDDDNVPAWFEHLLKLTRKGFVHISLQPFPPEPRRPTITPPTTPSTTTLPTTTPPSTTTTSTTPTTTTSTTTTVEPPTTTSSTTSTTSTTENTPEDSTTESTTTTTTETANDVDFDYAASL